ncbi:MAG: hydrogenase maturation nickel metallochaperone HypA [Anaerolineaceae bacterium]|nr:hydrogenase maturation nickel metallochaperone HypA [Anaerolineaceae bacterium]
MHELSITESILNIASEAAKRENARKVTQINLVIGRLSSIVDDSVQFYWDVLSEDTLCKGALLHFERIPAQLACLDCTTIFTLSGDLIPCPHCGSNRVKIVSGEEFQVDSIEIEK